MTSPCGASAQPSRPAAGRLARQPGRIGGPSGQLFGGLPDQAESLVDLVPPDLEPGQRVTGACARAGGQASDGYPS